MAALVIDTREREVIPFIEDVFEDIPYCVAQIGRGDYAIMSAATPLAVFERKTLADYAASFHDGRHETQLAELLDLRLSTGAAIYYLIEGPAFPSPKRVFQRVPYARIQGSLDSLRVRHGIHVIRAADQAHTARRLYALTRKYRQAQKDGDLYRAAAGKAAVGGAVGANDAVGAPATGENQLAILQRAIVIDPSTRVAGAWAKIPGITLPMGRHLVAAFSVAELVGGHVTAERLAALRTPAGRKLSRRALQVLCTLRQRGNIAAEEKLLTGTDQISRARALALLNHGRLHELAARTVEELAALTIPGTAKGKAVHRRLGVSAAARVHEMLHHRPAAE